MNLITIDKDALVRAIYSSTDANEQECRAIINTVGYQSAPTEAGGVAALICRQVAELPDRNSPEDWPEAMLVTHDELCAIVVEALSTLPAPSPAAGAGVAVPNDAFVAAYMAACAGRAPDHNEIGLHYFRAGAALSATPVAAVAQPVTSLGELRKAAHAGWMAACREVYSLVEETRKSSNITDDFTRGRCYEAKGIARTMGAFGPEDSDELRKALGDVMRAALAASPSCEQNGGAA